MKISLGSNIASLRAQRRLAISNDEISKTFERLSSGLRINRASDDAAGLAIADSLRTDSRLYGTAIRNINDGISALTTADLALENLSGIVTRLSELAAQSANGVYDSTQRQALDNEAQALAEEYQRIVEATTFNDIALLSTENGQLNLQIDIGTTANDILVAYLPEAGNKTVGNGTFEDALDVAVTLGSALRETVAADIDNDGDIDVLATTNGGLSILENDGSGNFTETTLGIGIGVHLEVGDFNNDGNIDIAANNETGDTVSLALGNGDGTFQSILSYAVGNTPRRISLGDIDEDGNLDIVASVIGGAETSVYVLFGNGDGTLQAATTVNVGDYQNTVELGDVNGDGHLDIVTGQHGGAIGVALGDGAGNFAPTITYSVGSGLIKDIDIGDVNNDGLLDVVAARSTGDLWVFLNDGAGTFNSTISYNLASVGSGAYWDVELVDLDDDGNLDLGVASAGTAIEVFMGNGNGSFTSNGTYAVTSGEARSLSYADFDGDGGIDFVASSGADQDAAFLFANTQTVSGLASFSLLTEESSREALDSFGETLAQISADRGNLGAYQSRLSVALSKNYAAQQNVQAAESRIRDADIAQEAASLVRLQILQQAATSILASANQAPSLSLALLS